MTEIWRVATTSSIHFPYHRWTGWLILYIHWLNYRPLQRCRICMTTMDVFPIGVHQVLLTWLSTVMWLLGKRGKVQFGGRERHITGMNILLSMSSVFAMCRNTTTDTLKPQLDVLTALFSSLSAGYGHSLTAGNTKIICRIPYWTIYVGNSWDGFSTAHTEKNVTALLPQHTRSTQELFLLWWIHWRLVALQRHVVR